MKKVNMVKYLMNILPNKPKFQEYHFVQELFRHPKYISMNKNEKEMFYERLVNNNIREENIKPFDLFFPSFDFKSILEGKRILDLGCGIGGHTISMGESWNVKEFYGIDFNHENIVVANHYITKNPLNTNYYFTQGYVEKMPYENNFFDAIVSHDVLEHVRSVEETLLECIRILKTNGYAFLVFPSIKLPFEGAHVSSVTKMPFMEWFFSPTTINDAYNEIINEWGDELNWFKPTEETKGEWAVVKGGIGVNGTRYNDFMTAAKKVGFSYVSFVKIPLLYVSDTAIKYPFVKFFSFLLKPLLSVNHFKDYLTQRLVFVVKK